MIGHIGGVFAAAILAVALLAPIASAMNRSAEPLDRGFRFIKFLAYLFLVVAVSGPVAGFALGLVGAV